jgi:plasmid replication initiation protein
MTTTIVDSISLQQPAETNRLDGPIAQAVYQRERESRGRTVLHLDNRRFDSVF